MTSPSVTDYLLASNRRPLVVDHRRWIVNRLRLAGKGLQEIDRRPSLVYRALLPPLHNRHRLGGRVPVTVERNLYISAAFGEASAPARSAALDSLRCFPPLAPPLLYYHQPVSPCTTTLNQSNPALLFFTSLTVVCLGMEGGMEGRGSATDAEGRRVGWREGGRQRTSYEAVDALHLIPSRSFFSFLKSPPMGTGAGEGTHSGVRTHTRALSSGPTMCVWSDPFHCPHLCTVISIGIPDTPPLDWPLGHPPPPAPHPPSYGKPKMLMGAGLWVTPAPPPPNGPFRPRGLQSRAARSSGLTSQTAQSRARPTPPPSPAPCCGRTCPIRSPR